MSTPEPWLKLAADAGERAKRIRVLIFDVDGVLTDGTIWFFPTHGGHSRRSEAVTQSSRLLPPGTAIPPGTMVEVKGFNAHDGIGLTLARQAGLKTGVITKRISESLALRARDLRMDFVCQGVERKLLALRQILEQNQWSKDQVCCMGDDIIDVPMLENCGLAAAPSDARDEVKQCADFVSAHAGGRGAARDVIEFILKEQGVWAQVVREYIEQNEGNAISSPAATVPSHTTGRKSRHR